VAAPLWFRGIYEFPIGLAACAMLTLMMEYRKSWRTDVIWAALAVWLFAVGGAQIKAFEAGARVTARSFYGSLRVIDSIDATTGQPKRSLIHGVVTHGIQLLNPELRREPTSYYARHSGIGMALLGLHDQPLKVGVIGLGAGTMAAYGRQGDEYWFYELDPLVIRLAQTQFSFLSDSEAKIHLVPGDGRLALERDPGRKFNLMAIDAFSGDSIPVHLLSREAFRLYFEHLAPGGVVAVHISNSFLDLAPVVGRAAQSLGKAARLVEVQEAPQKYRAHSVWVLLADHAETLRRFLPQGTSRPVPAPKWLRLWTDNYSNLFQIIK
jgi:spermidine synthase